MTSTTSLLASVPDREVCFVPAQSGEVLTLGRVTMRVMEDGKNTDNRLGSCEIILPPLTPGPPPHWHEMHDETFLITHGSVRFHIPDPTTEGEDKQIIDAQVGDYMVVPVRAPHTFSNVSPDTEARIFFTTTPAFYMNYFKLLAQLAEPDRPVPAEVNAKAMAMFATILADRKPRVPGGGGK